MSIDVQAAARFALEFLRIPKHKHEKTFMEITRYPHYENVISNILQFYFDTSNDHGLGNLMLKSLFEIDEMSKVFSFDHSPDVFVETELRTKEGKRIDLVIETRKYMIAVENKIYHHLANELNLYDDKIRALVKDTEKNPVKIVLSLKKLKKQDDLDEMKKNGFINITYPQFLDQVEKNIGSYINRANSLYLQYLTDFIKTIRNLTSGTMANKEILAFINEHRKTAMEIAESFKAFKEDQYRQVDELKTAVDAFEMSGLKTWIYDGWKEGFYVYGLANEMVFEEKNKISLDAILDKNGWQLSLIARSGAEEFLSDKLVSSIDFSPYKVKKKKNRWGIELIEKEKDDQELSEEIKTIYEKLRNYGI